VESHKIANYSATTEAREKSADLESVEFYKELNMCLTKFENNQVLLNKNSCRFLVTTKLFTA
jgi:hypothetical protein